jgi:hypothetical protein
MGLDVLDKNGAVHVQIFAQSTILIPVPASSRLTASTTSFRSSTDSNSLIVLAQWPWPGLNVFS